MADEDFSYNLASIPPELREAKRIASAHWLNSEPCSILPHSSIHDAIAAAGRNVHAVGIGQKFVDGEVTEPLCVRFHVVQKLANHLLAPEYWIPEEFRGFPTDVVESPPATFLATAPCSYKRRKPPQRPVVPGISAAHHSASAGTIGCFCRSTRAGDPESVYVLGTNHVFAKLNKGVKCDALYQPGPADGGTSKQQFAELHRFEHINLGGTGNRIDGAIGRVLDDVAIEPAICSIGQLAGTIPAATKMSVAKHGRSTGLRTGEITDIAYDHKVYSGLLTTTLFEDQIRIQVKPPYTKFLEPGDSGAIVVTDDPPRAVGLLFAGEGGGSYGVANPIDVVLSILEIDLM